MRAVRLLVGAALLLAPGRGEAVPSSVLPGLGTDPVREIVDVGAPPWRGVVRLQTEVGVRCTGALVGARSVLTAAHCLFGRGTGRLVRPSSVHILTSYSHGEYVGHARAAAIAIGPGFAMGLDGRPVSASPADADWALLTLDTELGSADRVLPLVRALPAGGTAAMLAGYEQDRAEVMVADTRCVVLGMVRVGGALLLRHSCAATRGASGAPLLVRTPEGGWGVAGVASTSAVGAAGGYAVPAALIPPDTDSRRR